MKHFLDNKYAIADHTIVAYSGENISLKIPEKINNISICTIGSGAFMELPELQYVMIPPRVTSIKQHAFAANANLVSMAFPGTVKEVGMAAFNGCKQLSDITIYDYLMDEQTYKELKDDSLQAGDEIYIAHKMPQFKVVGDVLRATGGIAAACYVPEGMSRLFYTSQITEDNGFQLTYRNLNNICFLHNDFKPTTEDQGFIEYLNHPVESSQVSAADEVNDRLLRINKQPAYRKTAIFTFDDKKTKDMNGKKSLSVTIRLGYFFFQSACRVICDGKPYYVYRRYYLSPDANLKFARRDVAIYTDEGVVMDKKEAEKVYAKYKFLCIL